MTSRPGNVSNLSTSRGGTLPELGQETSNKTRGTLWEDFDPKLSGAKAAKVWREMSSNDATIVSILFATTMLGREVDWTVPADIGEESDQDFLRANIAGLSHAWSDFVAAAFTALPFGFSFHETVYRMDEGGIVWDRFSFRPQESLLRWLFDVNNRQIAFVQSLEGGQSIPIPLAKGVLWKTDATKPEGMSVLRGSYRAWFAKKVIEDILNSGIERNLMGMPKGMIPGETLKAGPGDAEYESWYKAITRAKRGEQQGFLVPSDRDESGNLMYDVELIAPGGNPRFEQVLAVTRSYAGDMASTLMAQFIGLGRDAIGSRALAEPQQELHQTTVEAWLDQFEDVLNRQAVSELFRVNDMHPDILPRLVHGPVRDVDFAAILDGVLKMSQAGGQPLDGEEGEDLQRQLLGMMGLDMPEDLGAISSE